MNIKKHIPNFLTCCNLLCGCLGIIAASTASSLEKLILASILIFTAGIFDFFDGFVARLLKVSSPIGKELDSLADVISFGLLPGMIMYKLLQGNYISYSGMNTYSYPNLFLQFGNLFNEDLLTFDSISAVFAFIIPVFSALRLAKFNIDTRQTESFIGVPTPANAILIASFPLIISSRSYWTNEEPYSMIINFEDPIISILLNPVFLISFTIIMSLLLVAELPLFALKFKNFSWGDNQMKYILLIAAIVLLILLQWAAIPLIIFLYILLSFIENKFLTSKS